MNALDDELDFQILKMLQKDGRKSFTDIAKELNVAVSTIRNRYFSFIEKDIIKVIARIDPEKINLNSYAIVLLSVRPKSKFDDVINELINIPEITFLAGISGKFDIEINVQCVDAKHFTQIMHERINKIKGIYYSRTNFYLKIFKFSQPDLDIIKYYKK